MATTTDLNNDLSVGMSEVRHTLNHYNLTQKGWREYLLVRKPGCPGSFIILAHPKDDTGFDVRLMEFHKAECERESENNDAAPV